MGEVAAHALGRRKVPVELLLYDISNGLSSKLSPILLGRHLEAIYHSSVLVYGEEYWFGGKIFKNLPPNRRCFGEPLTESRVPLQASEYFPELRVVRLGHTLATCEEFHRHLNGETSLEFTSESYDVMTHNCNTFSNEAITLLTGHGIPDAVRRLPELVVNTPTVQLLRPLLNKILGGFRGEAIFWLDDGELCIEGTQCKSSCCQKEDWIELARCAPKSFEGELCDGDDLWDVYEFCPCETGLKCTRDGSSDGNRRCADPNDQ